MIFAGKLDTPISIQAVTEAQDAYGTPVETWTAVASTPTRAEYIPIRGAENVEVQKRTSNTVFKLRIRRWSGLTPKHRIIVKGMTADITSIEDYGRKNDMVVWCEVKA